MLVSLLSLAAVPAWAQGAYFGVGVGRAQAADASSNSRNLADQVCAAAYGAGASGCAVSLKYDESANGFSAFAGMQLSPYLAGEVGYVDLGTYSLRANFVLTSGGTTSIASATEEDKASAAYFAAVFSYPVTRRVALLGKLGLAYTRLKESCTVSVAPCSSGSDTGWQPTFGLGVDVSLVANVDLRVSYTQFNNVGDANNQYAAGDFRYAEIAGIVHFP